MFDFLYSYWEKNGYLILLIASVIFLVLCWFFKPRSSRGSTSDMKYYFQQLFLPDTIEKKKRDPKKTENRCREIVEEIFQKSFPSMRPDFLRNPETNRNLECDLMNPDMKLCIERNGEQHYKHVDRFHTPEQFQKQLERDKLKKELLEKNGYRLIEIPYTVHYDVLEEHIVNELSKYPEYKTYIERYLSDRNKLRDI